jgi:hypothetical protein
MSESDYSFWLQPSLKAAAERIAASQGISLDQFINVAIAEKMAALETDDFFESRAAKGLRSDFLSFLDNAGQGQPVAGDKLP